MCVTVVSGFLAVPGPKDYLHGPLELLVRIFRKRLGSVGFNHVFEQIGDLLRVLSRELGVIADPSLVAEKSLR